MLMTGSSRCNDLAVLAALDIAEIAGDVDELVGLVKIGDSHWLLGVIHITSRKVVCIDTVAYLLNIWILGPVAPLTGQYSCGGLN